MRPLTLADVCDLHHYAQVRDAALARIIALKATRRVPVGDLVTLVFENRATVSFQVHEMVRIERITRATAVQAELDAYNGLLPDGRDLSATCFLELTDPATLAATLQRFRGLAEPGAVTLRLADHRVLPAEFAPGHGAAGRIAAVHALRFRFTDADIAWWRSGAGAAGLAIDLPDYRHHTRIDAATRRALAQDFADGPG